MRILLRSLSLGLVAAAAALLIAPAAASASASVDPRTGADYAWYRPSVSQLDAAHIGWSARYIVPRSWGSGKALSASEAQALHAQGRTVVLNYEWNAGSERGGYSAGVTDARNAERARIEVGAPFNLPIYFSIDYDERNTGRVVAYLSGVASVLGKGRVGVYGGYYVVRAALDAGFPYAWQTYAWSGGRWDSRAQLRQVRNDAYWGGQGDADTAVSSAFGGWTSGGDGSIVFTPGVPSVGPAASGHPTARYGSRGAAVRTVQSHVGVTADGVFGPRTDSAVRRFQRTHGLAADGVVGPRTWAALSGVSAPAPAPAASSTRTFYTVHSGDTLARIAARYGTTWQRVASLSSLSNPNRIYPGERLRVR